MATEAQKKARKKYRDSGKRMTVDFYPSETELYEHIEKQPNKQGYIKSLIRADMERGGEDATEKLIDVNEVKKKLRDVKEWFDGYPSTEHDKLAQAVVKMCIDEVDKIKPIAENKKTGERL